MDDFEWLKDKVIKLAGADQEIRQLYDLVNQRINMKDRIYVKGPWAFKKLLILAIYIDIFTNVAKDHRKNLVYIDLLAGPGFNYIVDFDLVIAGSPLLAAIIPRVLKSGSLNSFDRMILVDNDPENCESLKQILAADILCADCNSDTVYDTIISAMKPPDSLFLVFVDPEGLEVQWRTMERVFGLPGDFVINYPYSGVARTCGRVDAECGPLKESLGRPLDNFFGTSDWRQLDSGEGIGDRLYNFYLERLKKYRSEVVEFPIMMVGGSQYRILVAARKTQGGSPWLKPVAKLKKRIESISDGQLDRLVDVYKGKQRQLTDFF